MVPQVYRFQRGLIPLKLSKIAIKRLVLLALAIIGCLLPALPAAAA